MIIRIENLPEGQTIKHINVDITFDERGTPCTTVTSETKTKTEPAYVSKEPTFDEYNLPIPKSAPPMPEVQRPQKDIPPEMRDLEF